MDLQRELGLRFEESAKLNARAAMTEVQKRGHVSVKDGTKGGKLRKLPINNERQIDALRHAAEIQGRDYSMIPAGQSYADFQREAYRAAAAAGIRFHGERHRFAQARYEQLLGAPCPLTAGIAHGQAHYAFLAERLGCNLEMARERDRGARVQVAEELGHKRVEISNAYLG